MRTPPPDDGDKDKHAVQVSMSIIAQVLARTAERDAAGQVGRPKDMHKEMQRVAAIFGSELDDALKPFHVQERSNIALSNTIDDALQHQKAMAEAMRQQHEADVPLEQDEPHAEIQLLTEGAQNCYAAFRQTSLHLVQSLLQKALWTWPH